MRCVRPGGRIIASGILLDNKAGVEQALGDAGVALLETIIDADWVTLVATVHKA